MSSRPSIEIIENDASDANDARVAAMIAMGLVPLHVDEDVVACYCGTCVVPDPHTSLRPQVTYLMRYFTATKEFDPVLRSHTATTLGRLVAARPDGMTDRMKEGIAEVLVRALREVLPPAPSGARELGPRPRPHRRRRRRRGRRVDPLADPQVDEGPAATWRSASR